MIRNQEVDDDKEAIIRQYSAEDKSTVELAEEYDVAPNTIRNRLKEWDVDIRSVGQRYGWLDDCLDDIIEQYVEQGDSLQTIADQYGTTTSPIKRRLQEAGVELRPADYTFTDEQISVIQGELLGDGCLYRRHETACHFKLENTVKAHPEYVQTKLPKIFPETQPYSNDRSTKWGDSTRWIIYSRGQELFGQLHNEWYERYDGQHRKVVPEGFDLDETAMLHWYLGDGSLSQRANGAYRLHFSTHGFPEASVRRLQDQLDSLGYDTYTAHASHVENGSGLAIYVSRESSIKLLDRLAEKNPIEAYEYKFTP
jgi:transposase-like protein